MSERWAQMSANDQKQVAHLRLCGKLFCFCTATRSFSGTHGFGACPVPTSSIVFQLKNRRQQEQLSADIVLASGQKAAESKAKSALHLDGAAETQMNPMTGLDVFGCLLLFLSGRLLKRKLFGLVWVLGPAALCPAGTPAAIFTLAPGGGDKLYGTAPACCELELHGPPAAI
mgnify:FL=1